MKLIITTLIAIALNQLQTSDANQSEADQTILLADSLLKKKENLRVFVKISNKEPLEEVLDFNEWPSNIEIVYNLITNKDCPILFVETPISESGDSRIENRYYFDQEGVTIATKTRRSFFNSVCVDGVLRETVTTYFDNSFNEIKSNRFLRDKSGNTINTSDCVMNYTDYFNRYRKFNDTPLATRID
ncbi:hypothetical protein [Ekhidna sp.]